MSENNVLVLPSTQSRVARRPFVPLTGNPENGDYLDFYRHTMTGEVLEFPRTSEELPKK